MLSTMALIGCSKHPADRVVGGQRRKQRVLALQRRQLLRTAMYI